MFHCLANHSNDEYLGEASISLEGKNQGFKKKKGKLVGLFPFRSLALAELTALVAT